tara:strand:- start:662 stop:886 length:225 start_codon:yes stop_codon:yes gene_type:complete
MENSSFKSGDRVTHDVFGEGVICNMSVTGQGPAAYIQFDESRSARTEEPRKYRNILVSYLTICKNDNEPVEKDG